MRAQPDRTATIVTGTDATIRSIIRVACRLALTLFTFTLTLARPTAGQATNAAHGERTVIYGAADRPAERWRLAATPSLVIGTIDGASETQFYNVVRVLRTADGNFAVGDQGAKEIRLFNATGRYLRSIGHAGRGPGEFPTLWELWRNGPNLVGVDGRGVAQEFASDGRFLRTVPRLMTDAATQIQRHGYARDGTLFGSAIEAQREPPVVRSTDSLTLFGVTRSGPSAVARFPHHVTVRRARERASFLVYGPQAAIAVTGDAVCIGYPIEYTFSCFDAPAWQRGVTVVRRGWRDQPVSGADRDTFFVGIDAANPGPRGAEYRRRVRETTTFAESFPAYGQFVPASDREELWIGAVIPRDRTLGVLNPVPERATTWSVYSTDGRWLADVVLPPRFRLMDAGSDYVAGVSRDANDVERVVVYRLLRDAPAGAGSTFD